jgi:hypothetical protein
VVAATGTFEMSSEDAYPVQLDCRRPDKQSRLTSFPLFIGSMIRGILLIPHLIILYFFQIAANILLFIATFAILFTGRYPLGMFNFYVGYLRWSTSVYGYLAHLYDDYPPFSMDPQPNFPLTLQVQYPEELSRILNFPLFIGMFIKLVLTIPHWVILMFLYLAAIVVIFIAQFSILFTGSFPEGMHNFVVGVARWYTRVTAYLVSLTDKYPPFSMS